jgi:hypothetical protein
MNRFLRNLFFALAVLLAVYSAAFANYLHANSESVARAKMVWLAVAVAVFLAVAGWRFSLKNKFTIFILLLSLLLIEIFLQATAWLGVLPGLETNLKAPFARVYWTAEGRGNGICNRYGWYYPPFDLKAAHKIVFVGDSQVEALEVLRTQNQAIDLQNLLKEKSPDWAVLGLGDHGSGPAFSIDVLEYAWRHFQPQEAIVAVSMGANVAEASIALAGVPPDKYIFYDLDADGKLVLNPASAGGRAAFDRGLEFSHQSLIPTLPVILNSHCMILQLADSLRDNYYKRRRQAELVARGGEKNGLISETFAINPSPEVQRAMKILLAQLQQCKNVCDSHGMKFHLVTIPAFPKVFYDSQHGRDWTMRIGDYDFFKPEREVVAWAKANDVPILSMGEYIRQKNLDVEEIRSLYFANGTGHLTVKGHEFFAQAIYETFYENSSF